ncbi:MAG: hypothetical protein AAGF67_06620 [Verrucomicrobiota bacterium]
MVLFPPSVSARGRVLLGLFALLLWAPVFSQEAEGEAVSEIPNRFFQTQDSGGYFWQPSGNGALTSGDTQYLQSGLNWLVDGVAFAPTKALVRSPDQFPEDAGVSMEETRDSLVLKRDLWIDRERGGVRALDTISNRGSSAASLEVVLRTTYPFAWQSLHGVDGELLSKDPVLSLDPEDFGMVVHFNTAEGRHDTFLVVAGEGDDLRPRVSASSNRRELSFSYRMVIPSGGTQSLLHWISQKSLPELGMAPDAFLPFYQRGSLVDPGLDARERAAIANFPPAAIPGESDVPGNVKALLSLNDFLDGAGLERRREDLHWISETSQISGTIGGASLLKIQANHVGELNLDRKDIAAMRTGAGDKIVFYLRNGEVRTGPILESGLTLTASESDTATELKTEEINLLLFGLDDQDGKPPAGRTHFFELVDRGVFAGTPSSESALTVATPFGEREIPWDAIEKIAHVTEPFSAHRVFTKKGSKISAFLTGASISLATGGEDLELPVALIERIWPSGATDFAIRENEEPWLSFDEVPGGEIGGFLLQGNAFLQGALAEATLQFSDNDSVIPIEAGAIQSLSRDFKNDRRVIVELTNGETLTGEAVAPFLRILWEGEEFQIPFESLIAYQIPKP